MKNFYKLNEENNYPMTYQGDLPLDASWKEFTVIDGIYEPKELNDALEAVATSEKLSIKLNEAKAYLASTDYIVTKIAEAQALGEDTTSLLSKYAVELQQRKEARAFVGANS